MPGADVLGSGDRCAFIRVLLVRLVLLFRAEAILLQIQKPGRPLNVGERLWFLHREDLEKATARYCPSQPSLKLSGVMLADPEEIDDLFIEVIEDFNPTWVFVKEHLCSARKRLDIRRVGWYRCRLVPGLSSSIPERITSPADAAAVLVPLLQNEAVEVCGILCLSTKSDVLAYHELSRGTLDRTLVHALDVFRTALLAHAARVVVAHNHPSGDPTPSPDDVVLTERLHHAGKVVGIELTDHVIVGHGRYYSFRESGRL